jgi:cytochrome P450
VLLFDNPASMERRRREPEFMPGAIEEMMRLGGPALARMEAQVCFTALLRRLPNLRPGAGERRIETTTPLGRQYKAIPIAWDPA